MKICQSHWDKIRKAIADRGLDHLGAKTGEEAAADALAQLNNEETNYDPLMSCNWMVMNRGIEIGGLYMMTPKEDGSERCPICEAQEHGAGDDAYWIEGPADAALRYCRENKLVPPEQ